MPYLRINGTEYYYELHGSGDETLVFSHGFLMDSEMFRYQIPYWSRFRQVLVFDWRGQGKSPPSAGGYDMENLYRDTVELLKALQLHKVHWIGVSMGGFIGLRLAARNPDLIQSLIAADTTDEAEKPLNKIKWGSLAWIFKLFGPAPVTKGIQKALFGETKRRDPSFRPIMDEYARKWKLLDRNAAFRTAWAIFNRPSLTQETPLIRIPVKVVVGEEDLSRTLEESRAMARRIPGASLSVVPKAGHSSPLEQPESFNQITAAFLTEISRR